MSFVVQQRGRFKTLVHEDGSPVQLITECLLHLDKGAYLHLREIQDEVLQVVSQVDQRLRALGSEYSPWLQGCQTLVVKRAARCSPVDPSLVGQRVEVDLRLGNFGRFGYCWLLHTIVPLKNM